MSSGGVKDGARNRKRLDPKNYRFIKLENQSLTKQPGQINGESFMIDRLINCDVIIADNSAQITMDDCVNTRIVIGPVKGSFFLRNCHNCHVTVACRQFRCVDCTNCTIRLYCQTESPVIESSSAMTFMPWNVSYNNLTLQFQAADLTPSLNFWNSIFDFTPTAPEIPQPHYIVSEKYSEETRYLTFDGEAKVEDNPVSMPKSKTTTKFNEWAVFPIGSSTDIEDEEKMHDSLGKGDESLISEAIHNYKEVLEHAAVGNDDMTQFDSSLAVSSPSSDGDAINGVTGDTLNADENDDDGSAPLVFGSMLDGDNDDDDDSDDDNTHERENIDHLSPQHEEDVDDAIDDKTLTVVTTHIEDIDSDRAIRFSVYRHDDDSNSDNDDVDSADVRAVTVEVASNEHARGEKQTPTVSSTSDSHNDDSVSKTSEENKTDAKEVKTDEKDSANSPASPVSPNIVAKIDCAPTTTESATASAESAADSGMVVAEWEDWEDWDAAPVRSRTETFSGFSTEELSDPRMQLLKEKNLIGPGAVSPGKVGGSKVSHSKLLRPSKKELQLEEEKEKEKEKFEEQERERIKCEESKKRKTIDMDAIACVSSLEELERLERLQSGVPSPRSADASPSGDAPTNVSNPNEIAVTAEKEPSPRDTPRDDTPPTSPTSPAPPTNNITTNTTTTATTTPTAAAAAASTAAPTSPVAVEPVASGDAVDWEKLTQARNEQLVETADKHTDEDLDRKYADVWTTVHKSIWGATSRPTIIRSDTRSTSFFTSFIYCLCGPPSFSGDDERGQESVLYAAATAMDSGNAAHCAALQGIYRNILGETCAMHGDHWTTIGFQGANPATDLRGTGIWGLLQLFYLTEIFPVLTKKLYDLSIDEKQRFPLAVSCINMSGLVVQWLRTPAAVQYRRNQGRNYKSVEEMAMQVYVACVYKLYCIWRANGYTIRDYSKAKSEVSKTLALSAHALVKALETGHREAD